MSVELNDRRQKLLAGGGQERVAKQHEAGKLTARERVAKLFDEDSFVETGVFTASKETAASVITGYGLIDERPVYVYAQDFTVKGGAMGEGAAKKIVNLMELAAKTGAPVVAMCDSAGASLEEGVAALNAYASVMGETARISGVVPQVSLILGPCAGGAAFVPAMGDVVIVADKVGQMFVTGPQVVSARTGRNLTAKDLGGGKKLAESGAAQIVVDTEEEAMAMARKVLSFLPSNNQEDAPLSAADDLNRRLDIDSYHDAHDAIARIADFNDYVELSRDFAPNMVTALARLGGRCVGLVANNPAQHDGVLCAAACKKAARFIRLCDCYNLPVVTLVNTPGQSTVDENSNAAAITAAAQLICAYAEAVVPKVSVLCGDAIGAAYAAMGSKANGADIVYAWPAAFIAPVNAEAAVRILKKAEIKDGADVAMLTEEYVKNNGALNAAENGVADDVIEPAATRQMIAAALEMLLGKREVLLPRKHGNLPL
jgi:acetyl-CoA carboxylase carboxyltransferase component